MPHGQYPVDIQINDERDVFLDATNDLATVGGHPNLEQSVAIQVLDATRNFIGSAVTSTSVGLLEERVREALEEDPQVASILSVTIDEYDRGESRITMIINTTEDHSFTLGVDA